MQDLDQGQPRVEAGQPLVIESRMSVKLLPVGDVVSGESAGRLLWKTASRFWLENMHFGFFHDYNVEAPVDVFLKSFQIFLAVLAAHSVFPPSLQRLTSPTAFPVPQFVH